MRHTLPLLVTLAAACATTTAPQLARTPRLEEPFQLKVGGRAEFEQEGFILRFIEVTADSRCPSNAFILCVWQGDAGVLVEIAPAQGDAVEDTLHTTLDPKSVSLGDVTLELVRLDPYPRDVEPIPVEEYRATFVVRRAD